MNTNDLKAQIFVPLWLLMASLALAQPAGLPRSPEGGLLFTDPSGRPPELRLENASFVHQPLPPEAINNALRKEDIITVLVDYRTSTLSEGESETIKTSNIAAVLADWIGFDGKSIFAAPQTRGDPTISGSLNSTFRAEGELELNDSLTFRIAAKVVDIYPNGNLVIEAHRDVRVNNEVWRTSLSGVVPRQAIQPDRTVRSDSIADLSIDKYEVGQVRNAYAPGWLNLWWGANKPF